jgi:hypothetical protein
MQEMDRRDETLERTHIRGIERRDFWLEIAVIVLICIEILLSIYGVKLAVQQGTDQDALMKKQIGILTNLQASTMDTVIAMKGLAEMTKAMNETTSKSAKTLEGVNVGVHDQLALFYNPALNVLYNDSNRKLVFQNMGRTNVILTTLKLWDESEIALGSRVIAPEASHEFGIDPLYERLAKSTPKTSYLSVPVIAHIKNQVKQEFIISATLVALW